MKKIIVPIDFSVHSENALKAAALIAKKINASLVVVHMIGIAESSLTKSNADINKQTVFLLKLSEKRFAEFLDKDYLKGISILPVVKKYTVFTELNTVAKEYEAEIIVMGSHGTSGFNEMFVGSNTEKVVRSSEVPVLVIKNPISEISWTKGVFACDFSPENISAYKKAKSFFQLIEAEMQLLYVNLPSQLFKSTEEMEDKVYKFLTDAGETNILDAINKVTYYNDYSVESGIFKYSQTINADIISLPTHGRQGLAHIFNGSIGEDIANHSDLPVLTVKI